jgi:hypothetical protein
MVPLGSLAALLRTAMLIARASHDSPGMPGPLSKYHSFPSPVPADCWRHLPGTPGSIPIHALPHNAQER